MSSQEILFTVSPRKFFISIVSSAEAKIIFSDEDYSNETLHSISDVLFFAVVSLDSPKTGALSKGVVYIQLTIRRHLILNLVLTDNELTFGG